MATQEKPVSNQLLKTAAALASILLAASLGVAAGRGPCRGRRGQDRQNVSLTWKRPGMPEGLVPSSIEFGGNAYKLEKQGEPYVDESYERQTAELEHDTTVEAGVLDVSYAIASMPATMDASTIDPLYEGICRLTASSRSPSTSSAPVRLTGRWTIPAAHQRRRCDDTRVRGLHRDKRRWPRYDDDQDPGPL